MSSSFSRVLGEFVRALSRHPDHQGEADAIRRSRQSLLVFFLPEDPAWEAAVLGLAEAHPLFQESGIGVIGVVPRIPDLDFFKNHHIPYPIIQIEAEKELACTLWQLAGGDRSCSLTRRAVMLASVSDHPSEWTDFETEALDSLILNHLLETELLLQAPEHQRLLLFFHRQNEGEKDPPDWKPAVFDLAAACPLFSELGLTVIGVVPKIEDPEFFRRFTIPFPLFQIDGRSPIPEVLWRLAHGSSWHMPEFTRYAVLHYTRLANEASPVRTLSTEFPNYDPNTLEAEVLDFLAEKNLVTYSPDSRFVLAAEGRHLLKRREKAQEEGAGCLNSTLADRGKKAQLDAYEHLMLKVGSRPPIGLAFSGGGIRAATFNLGLTQALARHRILPWVDYLSSVSGGGFTAAALTSLLSRRTLQRQYFFSTQWEQFPFNPEIEAFKNQIDLDADPDQREDRNFNDVSHHKGHNTQLSHLQNHGNYLLPRLGLAGRDMLRGIGTLLPGMGLTLVQFLLGLFVLACLHYFAVSAAAPAIMRNIDMTRLAAEKQAELGSLTVTVELDGQETAVKLPLESAPGEDGGQMPDPESEELSLPLLLFGRSEEEPPLTEPEESRLDLSRIPWLIYGLFLLAGVVSAWLAASFLASTYSFPRIGRRFRRAAEPYAQRPGERRDPYFPNPRRLLPIVWLGLLLTAGLLGWLLFGAQIIQETQVLLYPLVAALVGILFWLILRDVPGNGTVAPSLWLIGPASAGLFAFGLALGFPAIRTLFGDLGGPASALLWLSLAVGIFAVLLRSIRRWDADGGRWGWHGYDRWEWYDRFVLRLLFGLLLGVLLLALAAAQIWTSAKDRGEIFWIWLPTVFMLGALVFLGLVLLLLGGEKKTWASANFRTMIWALTGMSAYSLFGALLFAVLALPQILAVGGPNPASPAAPLGTALLSGLGAALLARLGGKQEAGETTVKRLMALPAGIRNAVLGLLVAVFWLSLIFLFETLIDRLAVEPIQVFGFGLMAAALLTALGSLLNFNRLSPHYFFADRIADVFLKTKVEQSDGRSVVVRDYTKADLKEICHAESSAPYHLVVTAVNLAGSGHQQDRDRKSRHFLFSKEFVGSGITGYVPTSQYRWGRTKYISTLALSGAAASPGLGTFTFFAQSFMMTLLNVRLGLWWVSPKEYRGTAGTTEDFSRIDGFENRAFWPLYLLDEAMANTSERRRLINITDGGHTRDNGGLYPLFKRRCRVIIAGDASQDPKGLCPDLFSVLHYVRVDLDIRVEIDVSRLKPAEETKDGKVKGMSQAHVAIGRIHYPAVRRQDGTVKHPAEVGWLVYFKPTISKKMPYEVLQFWETDKEKFPHPTTADQFFSERQIEAQRRLGEESVVLSLKELLTAYQDAESRIKDPQSTKQNFLKKVLEKQQIDFALLRRRPEILNELMRDWMNTVSPLTAGE